MYFLPKRNQWQKGSQQKIMDWLSGGFLIGGCVLLFVGRTPLKRGSLSQLPKVWFFNDFLIKKLILSGMLFFFPFFVFLKLKKRRINILGRRMKKPKAMQSWCSSGKKISNGKKATWTSWKHRSCSDNRSPLANIMSQAIKNLWNQPGWD